MSSKLEEIVSAEFKELDAYATRLEEELRLANERAEAMRVDRDRCRAVADAILRHRQIEVAAISELLGQLPFVQLDERSKTLVENVQRSMQRS